MYGKRKDSSKIAANVDLDLAVHRRQDDVLDQRSDDVDSVHPLLPAIVLKSLMELLHTQPVLLRHGRMQERRWFVGRRQERGKLRLARPELVTALHRIDPAAVREEVEAAGFVLDAESAMLANKDDPHSIKVFDPSIKGKTDRFAYRFVKP